MCVINVIKHNNLQELYPNVWISIRTLLKIPATVASGERSVSRLKLIKTYLRSSTLQERLASLGTLSIEWENGRKFRLHRSSKKFALKRARKVDFGFLLNYEVFHI